jgi:hypothetical protein
MTVPSQLSAARVPLFCDTALAARIERAEADLIARCSEAARRRTGTDGFVMRIAGGVASFAGDGSPYNKVAGLGFGGVPDEAALGEIERAFANCGSPTQVELAHLSDPAIGVLLSARGYQLESFENVLGRALTGGIERVTPPGIEVRPSGDDEFAAWLDVVAEGSVHPDTQGVPWHEEFPREAIIDAELDSAEAGDVRYAALASAASRELPSTSRSHGPDHPDGTRSTRLETPADRRTQVLAAGHGLSGRRVACFRPADTAVSAIAIDSHTSRSSARCQAPRNCTFNPASITCPSGTDTPACLTPGQVRVVREEYRGPTDPAGRNLYDGGEPYGSELAWNWFINPDTDNNPADTVAGQFGLNYLKYMASVPNPPASFTLSDLTFTDAEYGELEQFGGVYNATDPDLSAFRAHGGKLIICRAGRCPRRSVGQAVQWRACPRAWPVTPAGPWWFRRCETMCLHPPALCSARPAISCGPSDE